MAIEPLTLDELLVLRRQIDSARTAQDDPRVARYVEGKVSEALPRLLAAAEIVALSKQATG